MAQSQLGEPWRKSPPNAVMNTSCVLRPRENSHAHSKEPSEILLLNILGWGRTENLFESKLITGEYPIVAF